MYKLAKPLSLNHRNRRSVPLQTNVQRMRRTVFSICLLLCFKAGIAQQPLADSLGKLLAVYKKEDTVKLGLLTKAAMATLLPNPEKALLMADTAVVLAKKLQVPIKLAQAIHAKAWSYIYLGEFDSAQMMAENALAIFKKENYVKGEIGEYNIMGTVANYKGNHNAALANYYKVLNLANTLNDSTDMLAATGNLGMVYRLVSNFALANKYNLKALAICEQIHDDSKLVNCLVETGLTYREFNELEKAETYCKRGLEAARKIGNKPGEAVALGGLGNIYDEMGHQEKALEYLQQSIDVAKSIGYPNSIIPAASKMGIIYKKMGRFDDAIRLLQQGLELSKQYGDNINLSYLLGEMGDIYAKAPDALLTAHQVLPSARYAKVLSYHLQALQTAKDAGSLMKQIVALNYLKQTYEGQKEYKKALEMADQSAVLTDSVLSTKIKEDITRQELQYDFDKKEALTKAETDKKQALAAANIRQEQTVKNAVIAGACLLMVSAAIIFTLYKRRRDALVQQTEAEFKAKVADTEMKALRAQMNPHFIFNSLNSIADYIDKQDGKTASLFTVKFAKLMRMILDNSEQKDISLAKDLQALELYMQLEAMRMKNKFTYQINVAENIDVDNTLIPPLLLQPFVENSIWHGIAKKEGVGNITVSISKQNEMISCIIEDDGVGRAQAAAWQRQEHRMERKPVGTAITAERIAIVNKLKNSNAGVAVSDRPTGTRVELRLPVELAV